MDNKKPDSLFEVCFEACNKVGGIYTVVSSKAMLMKENYEDYVIVGPYYEDREQDEFEEQETPERFREVFKDLEDEGIICKYGIWKIDGEPETILIGTKGYAYALDGLKKEYWERFGIDSLDSGWDFFEPMLWSTAAGKLIEKYKESNPEKRIIGHFHEWISSFGILLLKMADKDVKTIFTTHATMLGRSLSGSGKDLYNMLEHIEPEKEAKECGVMNKFSTERACAKNADVFTTVSEITGMEAEKILGRKPEPLVFNGLDLREFPDDDEIEDKREISRDKLLSLAECMTGKRIKESAGDTSIFFTSGRYEFKNKGMDIFIDALARLDQDLKAGDKGKKVIAYFMVPNGWKNKRNDVISNIREYEEDREKFLGSEKSKMILTHDLEDLGGDAIMNKLKESGLTSPDSKVICIVVPTYLSEQDDIFGMDYYDITSGCDTGIFASYYEPWGYTPPECLAVGVPTVTSDLAGFGRYITSINAEGDEVAVLRRHRDGNDASIAQLKQFLWRRIDDDRPAHEIIHSCRDTARKTDWNNFIKKYMEAYDKALR